MKKCEQKRCSFNIMGQGCRKCSECGASPYEVDENCDRCWNCEHDEGLLRWDDGEEDNEVKQKEIEKPLVQEIKR